MVGDMSFRIMDVHNSGGDDFEDNGEPKAFHYFNIYSRKYIKHLLSGMDIKNFEIVEDKDFKKENIQAAIKEQADEHDVTKILGDWQINVYIMQPWAFIKIKLED